MHKYGQHDRMPDYVHKILNNPNFSKQIESIRTDIKKMLVRDKEADSPDLSRSKTIIILPQPRLVQK